MTDTVVKATITNPSYVNKFDDVLLIASVKTISTLTILLHLLVDIS